MNDKDYEKAARTTGPQTPVTLGDLRDAIFMRLDDSDKANAERHRLLVEKILPLEKTVLVHTAEIASLKRGSTAELRWPAWALVAVVAVGEIVLIGLQAAHMWSIL